MSGEPYTANPQPQPPIPPVFCKKSPQTIENKGREVEKESKEISRVRNGMSGKELGSFSTLRPACRAGRCPDAAGAGADRGVGNEMHPPTPPGFCIDLKEKGLRGNGFVSVWK